MPTSYTAYTVYAYPGGVQPGTGMAGRIIDNGTVSPSPNLQTSMTGSAQVEGVVAPDGTLCVAVDSYTGSAISPKIYDIATPSQIANPSWSEVINPWAMAALGDYVYVADWDAGKVVEVDPADSWNETGAFFEFSQDAVTGSLLPEGYQANCTALLVVGEDLYGLFSLGVPPLYNTYADSVLVRFTIDPTNTIEVASASDCNDALEKNAFTMAESGGDIYVCCIGGPQAVGGNPNSKLQSVPAASLTTSPSLVMSYNSITFPYEFRDISFNGGVAYVLATAFNSGFATTSGLLFKTTNFSTLSTIDTITGVAGYAWAAQYTPDLNRIWYARGNAVWVYNATTDLTVATLGVSVGQLMTTGQTFTNLGEMTYVGATTPLPQAIRGYRSPIQASRSAHAAAARQVAQGRPELTPEECRQVEETLSRTA